MYDTNRRRHGKKAFANSVKMHHESLVAPFSSHSVSLRQIHVLHVHLFPTAANSQHCQPGTVLHLHVQKVKGRSKATADGETNPGSSSQAAFRAACAARPVWSLISPSCQKALSLVVEEGRTELVAVVDQSKPASSS